MKIMARKKKDNLEVKAIEDTVGINLGIIKAQRKTIRKPKTRRKKPKPKRKSRAKRKKKATKSRKRK